MSVRDGHRLGVSRNVRLRAHDWYFAAAVKHPQRPSISGPFSAVLTEGERNATLSHFAHYLPVCAVCTLSTRLLCAFCYEPLHREERDCGYIHL